MLVGKRPIPLIVVADVTKAEAAAVDGEEGRERSGRGLVVRGGEEDAVDTACVSSQDAGKMGARRI